MTTIDPIEEFSLNDPTDFEPEAPPYEPNPTTESVLIDWQRVSAFKRVSGVIDCLEPSVIGFKGVPRNPTKLRQHLRVAVLNLFVAWKVWKWLAYPADHTAYSKMKRRFNVLRITKQFPAVMKALEAADYVEIRVGFRDEKTKIGYQTRAKATGKLIDLFTPIKLRMLQTPLFRESILLYADGVDDHGKPADRKLIDYADTAETRCMRINLHAYNRLIYSLIKSDAITFSLPLRNSDSVDFRKWFTYRCFGKGSFDVGGRFYGPWWVTLPSYTQPDGTKYNVRPFIRINGNAVVELDYSGLHPTLLYALEGLPLPDAPYAIHGFDREVVKQAVLISLNASSRTGALRALQRWAREQQEKTGLKDRFLVPAGIMDAIERTHAPIQKHFYTGAWSFLQRMDSSIAERIMNHFTVKGVPVLMIHDSFIVEQQHRDELHRVMVEAVNQEFPSYGGGLKPRIKEG